MMLVPLCKYLAVMFVKIYHDMNQGIIIFILILDTLWYVEKDTYVYFRTFIRGNILPLVASSVLSP